MGEAVDLVGILRRKAEEQGQSYDRYNQGARAAYEDAINLLTAQRFAVVTPLGFTPITGEDYSAIKVALLDAALYNQRNDSVKTAELIAVADRKLPTLPAVVAVMTEQAQT